MRVSFAIALMLSTFELSGLINEALAQESADSLRQRAKAVLAQLDGEIPLTGLQQPVEVVRDQWGIPHIYAQNQNDLFFAQGFVAAQDRLFQIDIWRRIGLGETAEILGEQALEGDRFARLIKYRGDMQAEWTSYAPDTEQIATAFTRGINAFIDQAKGKLPIEFQLLGYEPKKWQPEDILGRMSGIIMTSNWQREVARARLIAAVGVEKARLIAPTDPPREFAFASGIDPAAITPDILQGYIAATKPLRFPSSTTESNNWVLDGSLSASGKPLLASDPHRPIALPSLRYLVHLHAPAWNVIGSGEPALPGVAIGHNERIAWGFTIVGTDQADLFVEETHPQDPRQYKVGGQWQPMRIVRESIRVRGKAEPVEVELRYTRHGPIVYQDESKRVAFALKWVGDEAGGAAYLGSLSIARATNRDEFLKSMLAWKTPGENFVYADTSGDTGWIAAGQTPIRKNHDGLLPVPGSTSDFDWQGCLPLAELPQSFNPREHWLATANHNILPAGYQREIGYEWAAPHRFLTVQSRLQSQNQFTLADMQSIQHENTSLPAKALIGVLTQVEVARELSAYRELMLSWDGVLSTDAKAGPLYAAWLQELMTAFYADRIPKDARLDRGDLRSVTLLLAQLENPSETHFRQDPIAARDNLVRTTFAAAFTRIQKLLGSDSNQWSWGKLHVASLEHPLANLGPAFAEAFNLNSVPRPGDGNTPNNTRHDDNFRQIHGASYRHVFDLADWDKGLATSTPGQSGQPGSPHYSDLLPLWAAGQYFPLAYSQAKVEEVAAHRLRLSPDRPHAAVAPTATPLPRAHAHNDYEHARPLLDALDHGFCSVEADIWLTRDGLLVAHDRNDLTPERTLQKLYLDPLRERVKANRGRVYPNGPPFHLLIDVKTSADETYAALDKMLAGYADILTTTTDGKTEQKAVTIILSGNRAIDAVARQPLRFVGIDGRPENLETNEPAALVLWISANWNLLFTWKGDGPIPAAEKEKLAELVRRAHSQHRQVRFWATPENDVVWTELTAAGVDYINTDKLAELRTFLLKQQLP
jgi:penicillin amidase